MTKQPTTTDARDTLTGFLVGGAILLAAGFLVAALAWPGTEATTYGVKDTGSDTGAWIGLAVAVLGSCLLSVGLIGTGVRLGIESARAAAGPRE